MELQDLPNRYPPVQNHENSSDHRVKKSEEQLPKANVKAEDPPTQENHSRRRSSGTPSNIITVPRATKSPFLRFLILLSPQQWWARHISLVVAHTSDGPTGGDPRDYLALERTFLGYIRTATSLISFGVVITQLFVFKELDPKMGSVLGAVTSAGGIVIALIGCVRYFRQQKYLTHGKAISAGWDLVAMWMILVAILFVVFVIVLES